MKIVAGMGSLDDYIEYVNAGADEIFIGYVPQRWQERYGLTTPLNRREVCYYNVQIGSHIELEILADLISIYQVPVTIAFNGLKFSDEQYRLIAEILEECLALGYRDVIIADLGLLVYLNETGLTEKLKIHISGEMGEINHYTWLELIRLGAKRLIFHRKVSMENMEAIIRIQKERFPEIPMEYEAFILNENCHFHGAFCNSLHCDELVPMCRMPYRGSWEEEQDLTMDETGQNGFFYDYGLSELEHLQKIGITHLKVVGRGAATDEMIDSIRLLKNRLV